MNQLIAASLTAENTFSSALPLAKGEKCAISLSGTWAGTITLQRKINGTDWVAMPDTYSANREVGFEAECQMEIRIGFNTGGYTSGTASIALRS